jgi:inosine/xanthosine triphosphate pyrophosphatase family protein
MDTEQKTAASHRGKAVRAFLVHLAKSASFPPMKTAKR